MLDDLIARIQADPSLRPALVRDYARALGAPPDRIYRHLRERGAGSGRRRRRDAGSAGVGDEALDLLAAALLAGVRRTGQATMTIAVARQSLERSEQADFGGLSDGRLGQLLRSRRIDLATQRRGRQTHASLRTRGPNHVHQFDPSACLIRYLPKAGMEHVEAPYKNKQRELTVWRYLLVDLWSGMIYLDYFQQPGERPETTWQFLWGAWAYAEDKDWHGVPQIVMWDKGSATPELERGLRGLGVEPIAHTAGNARAKGGVESAQWMVERHFEARLWLQPAKTMEELRATARRWQRAWNADDIPGIDCRLERGRTKIARLERWQRIEAAGLREPPAAGRDIAVFDAVERRVKGDLTVRYRHPVTRQMERYRVGRLPGVNVGTVVDLQPSLRDAEGEVLVSLRHDGERVSERLLPIGEDAAGYLADAALVGEQFRPTARTEVERDGQRLRELIGPQKPGLSAMGGRVKALDAAGPAESNVVRFPARRGTEVGLGDAAPAAEVLPLADAARYLREALGEAWEPGLFGALAERWPRGASAADLDAWAAG